MVKRMLLALLLVLTTLGATSCWNEVVCVVHEEEVDCDPDYV